MELISAPENTVPKYATNVNFNKLKNGDIIMTFVSRLGESGPATVIETVIVDEDHAKKIVEILDSVLKNDNSN